MGFEVGLEIDDLIGFVDHGGEIEGGISVVGVGVREDFGEGDGLGIVDFELELEFGG